MQPPVVVWFAGLSGSGKSTLSDGLADRLRQTGLRVETIDGDVVRARRERPLDFSREGILRNGRDVIRMCVEVPTSCDVVLVSLITPLEATRQEARQTLGSRYFEVFVSTSVEECRRRDTKGLYRKEAAGEVADLIGVSAGSPFETPERPDFEVDTAGLSEEAAISRLYHALVAWDKAHMGRLRLGESGADRTGGGPRA